MQFLSRFMSLGRCAVSLAAMVAVSSHASAAEDADEASNQTDVIVVTGTLRESELGKTPLPITAITSAELDRIGAATFSDFYRSVPGLSVMDRGPNQKKFIIRGVQNDVLSGASTVGIYVDDMPISQSGVQIDLNLFDVERVEVLRGPQGTLYGASSMAGTVKYITKKPNPSRFEGEVRGGLSFTKSGKANYNVDAMVNVPLVEDQFAARIVAYNRHAGGYIDKSYAGEFVPAFPGVPVGGFFPGSPAVAGHPAYTLSPIRTKNANDQDVIGGRISLRATPTPELTLTATALYEETELDDSFAHLPMTAGDLKNSISIRQPQRNRSALLNFTMEYDFDWANLYSSTNYFDSKLMINEQFTGVFPANLTPPGTELLNHGQFRVFMQETRLASNNDSPFQWLGGFWSYRGDTDFQQLLHVQENDLQRIYSDSTPTKVRQWAIFGELSYNLTERLKATVGARYWNVSLTNGPQETFVDQAIFFLPVKGIQTTISKYDDTITNMKYNLSYQATDNFLIYGQAAQGFRIGGFNTNPTNDPNVPLSYGSDSLWNYEIGAKAQFLDGRLNTDISLYYIDWSDIQTRVFVNGAGFNGNAGKAHILGLEFAANARPTDQLTFSLSGAISESVLDEDQPINALFPTGFEGKKGDRLPGVPQFTLNASAEYEFPLSGTLDGSLYANISHTGNSFTKFRAVPPANTADFDELNAYTLVNLRFSIASDKWDIAFFADNIFDKRAELDVLYFLGQDPKTTTNRPRTIGVRAGYRF